MGGSDVIVMGGSDVIVVGGSDVIVVGGSDVIDAYHHNLLKTRPPLYHH